MAKSKGIYVAVAPLVLLLIAGVGAHFLPILLGDNAKSVEDDEVTPVFRPSKPHKSLPPPTPMPPLDAQTQATLKKVVQGQITAFHSNDFAKALTYSVPRFRESVTPDNFKAMIYSAYPPLVQAVTETFADAHGNKSDAAVPVTVIGEDGRQTRYMYILAHTDGGWFVTTCTQMGSMMPMNEPVSSLRVTTSSPKQATSTVGGAAVSRHDADGE